MSGLLGAEGRLFINAAGIGGGGTWLEVLDAKDVNHDRSAGEVDYSTRGSGRFRQRGQGLREFSIDFTLVYNDDDNGVRAALEEAWEGGDLIGAWSIDGGASNTGFKADMVVLTFQKGEPMEDAQTIQVSLKNGLSVNNPQRVTGPPT